MSDRIPKVVVAAAASLVLGLAAASPAPAGGAKGDAAAAARSVCPSLRPVPAAGVVACTHGADLPPTPATANAGAVAPAGAAPPPAPCASDGTSGRRIRVFYGYPKGTKNRVSTFRSHIRTAIGMADVNLDAATSGLDGQHYRLYCRTDTVVSVRAVQLKPIGKKGVYGLTAVIDSLQGQKALKLGPTNYRAKRFVYVVFADNIACCFPYAGQGTLYIDDQPDPGLNANNLTTIGPRFSLVRLGWSDALEAGFFQHEVGHNLGAVQYSATHSSGAGHCYEELDVMCYADGGPYFETGVLVENCPGAMPDGQEVWDCGADDYYAGVPPVDGDYLFDHWNTANSGWLSWTA